MQARSSHPRLSHDAAPTALGRPCPAAVWMPAPAITRRRSRASGPDPQLERPAEGDVRVEAQLPALHQPQAREAPRQLLERELRLELAERRPDAEVDALAEREVALRVRAAQVEHVGLREHGRVAP